MPIVEIEIVLRPNESLRNGLPQELADALGAALDGPPGSTWVKLHTLAEEHYAESGGALTDIHPVFVSILKSALPAPEQMQIEIEAVADAVARLCDRPRENVHVLYEPEGRGRVAFGGRLTR
jgi:phenylpyruvate tautomerase PptA (4-oxalocrotonate tautomerase family)